MRSESEQREEHLPIYYFRCEGKIDKIIICANTNHQFWLALQWCVMVSPFSLSLSVIPLSLIDAILVLYIFFFFLSFFYIGFVLSCHSVLFNRPKYLCKNKTHRSIDLICPTNNKNQFGQKSSMNEQIKWNNGKTVNQVYKQDENIIEMHVCSRKIRCTDADVPFLSNNNLRLFNLSSNRTQKKRKKKCHITNKLFR